jgi:hypothetical protein
MPESLNPYAAPQSPLTPGNNAAQLQPPAFRWEMIDWGYRLGFLTGCAALLILIVCAGLDLPGFWLLTGFFYAVVALPVCTLGGFVIGVTAAALDRMLQALGWRVPPSSSIDT